MAFSGPIEDRLAIRELMDIYADAVNQRDAALWGSTWADGSSWKLPVIPGWKMFPAKRTLSQLGMPVWRCFRLSLCRFLWAIFKWMATRRRHELIPLKWVPLWMARKFDPAASMTTSLIKVDGQWFFIERIFNSLYGE